MRGFVSCFSPKFKEREKKRNVAPLRFFFLNVLRVSNPNISTDSKKERKRSSFSLFGKKIIKKRLSQVSLFVSVITCGNVFVRSCDVRARAMNFLSRRTQKIVVFMTKR